MHPGAARAARKRTEGRRAAALMYLSGCPAVVLADHLGLSRRTIVRIVWQVLYETADHHGCRRPVSLRGLGDQWFYLIASLPEAG